MNLKLFINIVSGQKLCIHICTRKTFHPTTDLSSFFVFIPKPSHCTNLLQSLLVWKLGNTRDLPGTGFSCETIKNTLY